jgi:pilus assembly protein Flp/PilA
MSAMRRRPANTDAMEAFNALLAAWSRLAGCAGVVLRRGQAGQGYVEYALILILMALVVLVLLSVVGHETNNVFSNISVRVAQ